MSWKLSAKTGEHYELWPLHRLSYEVNEEIVNLLANVPKVSWEPSLAWERDAQLHMSLEARDRRSVPIDCTLVLLKDRRVVGVYRAYESEGCNIRTKTALGAALLPIGAYVNIGPSVAHPEVHNSGLYSQIYELRLKLLRTALQIRGNHHTKLLAGVIGTLEELFTTIYRQHHKECLLIPREAYSNKVWGQLGDVRPQSMPAFVLAQRHGLKEVGFKKTDGGPVLLG